MSSDTEVVVAFDKMYAHSTRGTPTASRFLTLKALVLLGQDWHSPTEILRKLKEMKVTTNTNYIFEIIGRFPALAEANEDKSKVRIPPKVYASVMRQVDDYIAQIHELRGKK